MADIKYNLTATRDPGAADDATVDANGKAYAAGSLWTRTDTGDQFVCQDPTIGAAKWVRSTPPNPHFLLSGQAMYPQGFVASADGQQTALRYIAEMFVFNRPTLIDGIGVDVVTGQPGALVRLALYVYNEMTGNLDLVKDAGDVGLTSAGNKFTASLGLTVGPGRYFAVGILQSVSTMPTLRAISQLNGGIYGRAKGNNLNIPAKGLASLPNSAYPTAMPATLLTSGTSAGNVVEWHNSADCFVMSLARG
jgi:hypothetical protein